ncbi:MAG: hypothetical protein EKK53_19375 [Burkholderiales bacterium]|nr:MAG: hypothetical protein EKK53_19375 [Burkholderiales bacterium]
MSESEPGAPAVAFFNLRDGPAVDAQPRMEVHSWRLIRAPAGTLHLVTLRDLTEERGTVRVTSAITAVDLEAGIVTTSSGRQYALMRPAEEREFERELLQGGAVRLGLGDAVDVSVLAWDQVEIC